MKITRKSKLMIIPAMLASFGALTFAPTTALAWTDQTHMAIERTAGLRSYQNACTPDVSKTVSAINKLHKTDGQGHFYDAAKAPTRQDVDAQLEMIGMSRDDAPDGWILGAIVNATRKSKAWTEMGRFDDYNYAILGHYIGDLSQPLHMSVYDDFNRKHHLNVDQTLNHSEVKWDDDGARLIAKEMTVDDSMKITNEDQLIDEMLKIANESYELGQRLRAENRELTHDEALARANRSATFFRAVMKYCGKKVVNDETTTYTNVGK
jgi:hypothetical protein